MTTDPTRRTDPPAPRQEPQPGADSGLLARARRWARGIKRDVVAVWLAARDPRTPAMARITAVVVAAYALSPIDLIPDFIPVLGYLDDLLIVPLGIMLVVRLVPETLMHELRERATRQARPVSRATAVVFVLVWIACAAAVAWWWAHGR